MGRHKWTVLVLECSLTRDQVSSEVAAFNKRVLATSEREAVDKCLPAIKKQLLPVKDSTIKWVRVFAGRTHGTMRANRMCGIQIDATTGERRQRWVTIGAGHQPAPERMAP